MTKLEEFWYCVAPQEDLPLYDGQENNPECCKKLIKLIERYKSATKEDKPEDIIKKIILENPKIISDMRVLVGVSDKRFYLDLTYLTNVYADDKNNRLVEESRAELIKHTTSYFTSLLKHLPMKKILAELITDYFVARGLISILNTFINLTSEQITSIYKNLIAPKEIQQVQAKYRGHGAEQAFARMIDACDLAMIPADKATDPMAAHDPNVDLSTMQIIEKDSKNPNCHSFDLIIKDASGQLRVLIQSLIHSSDPGQFGVDKSTETINIKNLLNTYNVEKNSDRKVYLLGSVDGVGFCENPNGTLVKMLGAFDDFFQMHTLFKIPIFLQQIGLIDTVVGVGFDTEYFEEHAIKHFCDTYLTPNGLRNMTKEFPTTEASSSYRIVSAGKGNVFLKNKFEALHRKRDCVAVPLHFVLFNYFLSFIFRHTYYIRIQAIPGYFFVRSVNGCLQSNCTTLFTGI